MALVAYEVHLGQLHPRFPYVRIVRRALRYVLEDLRAEAFGEDTRAHRLHHDLQLEYVLAAQAALPNPLNEQVFFDEMDQREVERTRTWNQLQDDSEGWSEPVYNLRLAIGLYRGFQLLRY
ncbi:MAG: hypothetical protein U0797_00925 [Gemmataceae bacterium]